MCGIVGVIVKGNFGLTKKSEDTFFQMLYADALRGDDSTGIIAVENNSTFTIAKEAITGEEFIKTLKKDHAGIISDMYKQGKVYIGHNRKKTVGAVKDETAHPFVVGNHFAMVHNGTLHNHSALAKDCEVDSEALAIHLQAAIKEGKGEHKTIMKELEGALAKVFGAYAVAIYDQEMHRVYLLRNKDRPLSVLETDDAWYFMSESLMGAWILPRNGYKYNDLKFDHIQEHELFTFDLNKNKMMKDQLSPKWKPTNTSSNSPSYSVVNGGTRTISTESVTAGNRGKPCKDKKDLKKFEKQWLGKRISFWLDDYVETDPSKSFTRDGHSELILMGGHDEIDWWHTVVATVDVEKVGIHYEEDLHQNKWSGVIEAVGVSEEGVIQIHLSDDTKPLVKSHISLATVNEMKTFKESLRLKTRLQLMKYQHDNAEKLDAMKHSAINAELAFRAGIKSMDDAREVMKKLGSGILEQRNIEDHWVYTDNEGRVFYETAITVH